MTTILILFLAGLALVAVEVVIPGGILGILGALCMIGGVIASFIEFGAVGGSIATVVVLVIGVVVIYLEFVVLPKTKLARKFSLTETVAGRSQPEVAEQSVVGREVTAVTTLSPSGYVEVDGRRYEAFSRSGHVAAGARLRVVEIDTFRVIVTQIQASS